MTGAFFQSDLVVATYDALTEQANQQILGDLAFYTDCAERYGGPVLELGVGTGRVAWALAEAGYQVLGVDLSEKMLAAAKVRGELHTLEVRGRVDLRMADMADFDLDRRFPLALVPFSAFQLLTTAAAQRACLTTTRRHLDQGGRLVLDVFDPILDACVPGSPSPNPDREAIDPLTGDRLRRRTVERVNDPLTQTFKEAFRLERIDAAGTLLESLEAVHHMRWATRQEMLYLFELSGFEVEAAYSDFERHEPAYGKRQVWIVKAA